DAHRHELAWAHLGVAERLARHRMGDLPDLASVVLYPAGPWEMLGELAIGAPDGLGALVEHDAGGSGGALIDREDHRGATLSPREVHTHEVDQLATAMQK